MVSAMSMVPSILQDGRTALEDAALIVASRADCYPAGITAEDVMAKLDRAALVAADAWGGVTRAEILSEQVDKAECAAGCWPVQ